MEVLKRNLELVEIKNLQEIYHLTSTLFIKRKEIQQAIKEFNQEGFIKKITPYIKNECVICNELLNQEDIENIEKINKLYDFFNEFNDIFGEEVTYKLLKKVGFIDSHIKSTIESLHNVTNFRSHLSLEELFQWDNKSYLQSVQAHKEVSERTVELEEDLFKPLISYFINDLSKDKKAEFLLKLELFKKSGWAQYIAKEGNKDENQDIVKLFNFLEESRKSNNKNLDYKTQQEFRNTFERFFETIELGISVNEKGLNIASISNKNTGLYNLAGSGMPDGAVIGCPQTGRGDTLYVGWATANTKKFAQNLQWFRHLEGIDFSIKMKRKGFEKFSQVDGSIVSLAINHDAEDIGFIKNKIDEKEKKSFQILGETTEICKGLSIQNGRYKDLISKFSSISLIGSKTELILTGKSKTEITKVLLEVVKNVNKALQNSLEQNGLTDNNKVKREIYITDFCNAISYLSEIHKQNIEFKEFLKNEISPTFVGLAKFYPEMSNHLSKTLSFAMMNTEGMVFDVLHEIENNANIGFERDYLQRGFYHFDEKVKNLNEYNKEIDNFILDVFEEIKNPLYEIIFRTEGYHKLDKKKENSLWHMLKIENIPNKPMSNYDKEMKEVVSKFKSKKTANKCLEFFKDIQKGFPHLTLLSSVDEINVSKKQRLMYLMKVKEVYENQVGKLDEKIHSEKIKNLELIKKMTETALKDIEVLEHKAAKEIRKEIEAFIDESIKDKNISKDLIMEEINHFEFNSEIKNVLTEIINKRKETSKKI